MSYRRRRRSHRPSKKSGGVFSNRRNPRSGGVSIFDIVLNIKEGLYCWWHRVPRGSELDWKKGKIVGHRTRVKK